MSHAMLTLRATVIMKTDLFGSTPRFRALSESDLSAVLATHQQLVAGIAARHAGEVVKSEGDAFWIAFPSVTAACLAGLDMQDDLRLSQPGKGDDRLAMRIVITLGDMQIEEGALVGDPVVLAARIESVTPPDEVYLSLAAWLAVRSAEVQTSFVGTFSMKGFDEPVPLYRVESRHRTRVFEDQYLVVSDLKGFGTLIESQALRTIESVLDELLELTERVCQEFDGTTRFSTGDAYCLTFTDPGRAMTAVERLRDEWEAFDARESLACSIKIAVHKGTLNAYRAYVYGRDVRIAFSVEGVMREPGVYVTGPVRDDLAGTAWEARLQPVSNQRQSPRMQGPRQSLEIYRLV